MPTILSAFKVPALITLPNRRVCEGMEALCILLKRLTYPNRFVDSKQTFSRKKSDLSLIVAYMIEHVDSNFGFLLASFDLCWLELADMQSSSPDILTERMRKQARRKDWKPNLV